MNFLDLGGFDWYSAYFICFFVSERPLKGGSIQMQSLQRASLHPGQAYSLPQTAGTGRGLDPKHLL
jgi:hypothetical protein